MLNDTSVILLILIQNNILIYKLKKSASEVPLPKNPLRKGNGNRFLPLKDAGILNPVQKTPSAQRGR